MPKTVIIAEDHPFTAQGIEAALATSVNLDVIGRADNGIEAIALIKRLQPDCALLDLSLPGANGLEIFLEAKRWSPQTRFAILTGASAGAIFKQLVDAGINGLFVKNASAQSIRNGIEAVANGARVISPDAQELIDKDAHNTQLSKREIEVLQNIARGYSNRVIAKNLGLSPKTIDSHRTNLLRKMGVNSTPALLVAAMRSKLIGI